eukprot:33742-Eustigmatos_ZCMA.PRE.1
MTRVLLSHDGGGPSAPAKLPFAWARHKSPACSIKHADSLLPSHPSSSYAPKHDGAVGSRFWL